MIGEGGLQTAGRAAPDAGLDVSILVVGYNSAAYLGRCIQGIGQAVTRYRYELLFVNNGTDGSEDLLRSRFPEVRILPSRGNVGFAAANNYLADHARGRWLLLLNPDTELHAGAVDILLETAERHRQYSALGGVTIDADGRPGDSAMIELPGFETILRSLIGRARAYSKRPGSGISEPDALTGGFMMVDRACWDDLKGMDASFFLYAEELDFFKRLKDRGGRVAQVEASRVYHEVGSGEVFSPARMRFKITGRAHYLHKHFSAPYAYLCIFLIWITLTVRFVAGRLMARRNQRYARMADSYAHLVLAPRTWIRGYRSPGADPREQPR
jgi:GT2 family glycosyltransferase